MGWTFNADGDLVDTSNSDTGYSSDVLGNGLGTSLNGGDLNWGTVDWGNNGGIDTLNQIIGQSTGALDENNVSTGPLIPGVNALYDFNTGTYVPAIADANGDLQIATDLSSIDDAQGPGTDLSKTLSSLLGTKVGGLGTVSDLLKAALTTAKAYGMGKNILSPQGVPKFTPRASVGAPVDWGRGSLAAPVQRKAEGGAVESGGLGTLREGLHSMAVAQGLIPGSDDGQSDKVPIYASPGEYIWDAESVSMLGNGNTEAGAKMLDEMRQSLREHKRSAGPGEIAPASGSIEQYLGGR